MLRALRTEMTRVQMDILYYDSDDEEKEPSVVHRRGGRVYTQPDEFAHLRIRVTNLSRVCNLIFHQLRTYSGVTASSLILTTNLFCEPLKHVIFQGVLLDIPIGRLDSQESRDIEIPVCFVSCGRFDIRAEVQVFDASQGDRAAGAGRLVVIIRDE